MLRVRKLLLHLGSKGLEAGVLIDEVAVWYNAMDAHRVALLYHSYKTPEVWSQWGSGKGKM